MDIVGGLAAASQALGIAKALRGIEKDYDAATYRAQIAELIDALTDAKLALTPNFVVVVAGVTIGWPDFCVADQLFSLPAFFWLVLHLTLPA